MIEATIIAIASTLSILVYKYIVDPNHDIERHYHRHDKTCYYLLQVALATLALASMYHSRYVMFAIVNFLKGMVVAQITKKTI